MAVRILEISGTNPNDVTQTLGLDLSAKQRAACSMIAAGQPQREVAQALGVRYQTVSEWSRLPHFRAHVREILSEVDAATRLSMIALRGQALETVRDLLVNASPAIRLTAAKVALDVSIRHGAAPTLEEGSISAPQRDQRLTAILALIEQTGHS